MSSCSQNNEYVRQGESALAFMLPEPLISYLDHFGPEDFLAVMNTDATNQPDLIWCVIVVCVSILWIGLELSCSRVLLPTFHKTQFVLEAKH